MCSTEGASFLNLWAMPSHEKGDLLEFAINKTNVANLVVVIAVRPHHNAMLRRSCATTFVGSFSLCRFGAVAVVPNRATVNSRHPTIDTRSAGMRSTSARRTSV